ncbi:MULTISPECIES: enoyl-CoA hydratase/isomerase family protein [unclassified Duganella]|uniref:enoyl-CoA hydratase/isomerase family protein n=1 Tax=unclassified Duganella TaxID=2636909 RepID=UPI0008876009|nr:MULTISPECIES: enoyl-CoA hydratase/isomerase family protein [unclassified Duganella]SDG58207.1 Enoyl-CoA hydratase/carnithine racemase [Duganella sp. OV458]SDJ81143.1 3-hydroxyacyl-CoA dehydrogenase / enoyl-CoA hydratase / 3-hydroxybutyryl-CoA epimerase [Duganella sp. OV510]
MITTHQNGGAVTVLLTARAINPLSRLFQRELATLLEKLESRRDSLSAVIIGFDPGPQAASHELEHLMALTPAQAADCMHMLHAYNGLLQRLENLGRPVIAALSGEVSGHAFGLALACHQRLSLRDTRFSLPQVRLGLAPVAGEIVRTVRLAGLQAAMPLLLEGAVLEAEQARRAGLLHAIAANDAELARLSAAAQDSRQRHPRPRDTGLATPALRALLHTAPARLRERADGASPAAEAILCAMVEGAQVDFHNALLIESRYFCQTAINPAPLKSMFSL